MGEIIKKINGLLIEKRVVPERSATELWRARPEGVLYVVWTADRKKWNTFHDLEKAVAFAKSF